MATETGKEKPGNIIMVGLPSKDGLFSVNAMIGIARLATPMNVSLGYAVVNNRPVDEARNIIVEHAKDAGAKYLFFIDDDTICPAYAIPRLLNLKKMVASGVYYTKAQPPVPVLIKQGVPAGYEDWNFGDIFSIDYAGCGCMLIDMRIFNLLDERFPGEPYFKYVRSDQTPEEDTGSVGEDVWFCRRAKEVGHEVWVDSAIQCIHEDWAGRIQYFHYEPARCGAWKDLNTGLVRYLPSAAGSQVVKAERKKAMRSGLSLCWGYGGKCDGFEDAGIDDPAHLIETFCEVKAVKIRNVIEFRPHEIAFGFLRAVYSCMSDGATVEIRVPNIVARLNGLTPDSTMQQLEGILGFAGSPIGSVYTRNHLSEIGRQVGFVSVTVEDDGEELVMTGRKGNNAS